jgi:hypothetical protein
MRLINKPITKKSLIPIAHERFGNLIKAVIDVKQEILVIDADLHSDEEQFLLEQGSNQYDLWGINLYPKLDTDWIEFDSMINVRPRQGNTSRSVDNPDMRKLIITIVTNLIR